MSFKIEFRKAGKVFEWNDSFGNILDFAEAKGIQLDHACLVGVCGTCKARLISGRVFMETEEGLQEEDRAGSMFLPCVAVPETDIVIDA